MMLFWKNHRLFAPHVNKLIMTFFGFSILAELVLTSYLKVNDISNMFGHICHLTASYLLYKAVVETGLKNPFDLLFRNLNEAVNARDEFISLASHELKTPLTPLKLQLQMLKREVQGKNLDTSSEKISKLASRADEQAERLSRLIDGMLDVSRLNTGRFEIVRKKTDLSHLISQIAGRHESEILAVNSSLTLKLEPTELEIDPLRIEQTITNLLLNAVKYAPGSAIEIGIKKRPDGSTQIWVQDDGPGIPKQNEERIFQRFERATQDSSAAGLGLGLYICRQIVAAHGGTIHLDNNVLKGSRFVIELPQL